MKFEVLKLLSNNAKYTSEDIATMLGISIAEVEEGIKIIAKTYKEFS